MRPLAEIIQNKEYNMNDNTLEMIRLYYDEFKYRHEHFWNLFFKFAYAILFFITLPFFTKVEGLKAESFNVVLDGYSYIFPVIACVLSLLATFILLSEYERLSLTIEKCNQLKDECYKPIKMSDKGIKTIFKIKIGIMLPVIFLISMFAIAGIELFILIK